MRFTQLPPVALFSVLLFSGCNFENISNAYNPGVLSDNSSNTAIISKLNNTPTDFELSHISGELLHESMVNVENGIIIPKTELNVGLGILEVGLSDEHSDFKMSLDVLTGKFTIGKQKQNELHSVGTDISGDLLAISINDTDALKVETNSFDAMVDGENNTIYIQNDFELNVVVTNVNGEFSSDLFHNAENPDDQRLTGTISIEISADTTLVVDKFDEGFGHAKITKIVNGGPMTMQGSNYFSFNETITVGECFIWEDDYLEFGSGFERVNCPM